MLQTATLAAVATATPQQATRERVRVETDAPLTTCNTLRVAATARYLVRVGSGPPDRVARELAELLADPRFDRLPRMVLGGGSNVLFAGDYPGVVILPRSGGIAVQEEEAESVIVTAAAGHDWHRLVGYAVARGWGGIENLSLIPGSVGAAPIQNIGAYGAQLSDVFVDLQAVPLAGGEPRTMDGAACAFGYRDSVFKHRLRDRMLITEVRIRLPKRPRLSLEYAGVRDELAQMAVADPTVADVSRAIVRLRRRKLPDPELLPNAGSFFKNPVLTPERYERVRERCPRLAGVTVDGGYKVPAAQLIEACGLRGRRFGRAGVAERHALVLVNHGGATGAEMLAAAAAVEAAVMERFEVRLEREVRVIGCER
jgi:UDP-N-acetylmuramate dehydrogenase